jgi:hypothetical protein
MTDFLFHKVSEPEKEEIKKQAKAIIDDFSDKLESIGKKTSETFIERDKCFREEKNSAKCDEDFRRRMFLNAPNKNNDFIIAEKKTW